MFLAPSGRRRAPAALVLVVVMVLLVVVACGNDGDPEATTTTAPPTTAPAPPTTESPGEQIDAVELESGQCFDYRDATDDEGVTVQALFRVDCALPHDNEVYAIVTHAAARGEPYPGDDALVSFADDQCFAHFEDFVGKQYELSSLEIGHIRPSGESWAERDRTVYCFVFDRDGAKLSGSAAGSQR
jgi:Septum formation